MQDVNQPYQLWLIVNDISLFDYPSRVNKVSAVMYII